MKVKKKGEMILQTIIGYSIPANSISNKRKILQNVTCDFIKNEANGISKI
jgi:hypothetical protein